MKIRTVDKSVFIPSPAPGTGVFGGSFYVRNDRPELLSLAAYMIRNDTKEVTHLRRSTDNGRTWQVEKTLPCRYDHPAGVGRRNYRGGYVDPATGRLFWFWNDGVRPTDHPLENMKSWRIHYSVSEDGGRTWIHDRKLVHQGPGYNEDHYLPYVTSGKNCAMFGDFGQRPITRSDGALLLPVQISHPGPDGNYLKLGAGATYTDCLLLVGTWRADGDLDWQTSELILADPERTTRGLIEPTIAMLSGERLLMVMRGSNDARPELPGYRWRSISEDGGLTWSRPEPWTWTDHTNFFSPSSCSQLLPHSNGKLYWIGNISPSNPRGNLPRYPLVMGEVDLELGGLRRDSVAIIDDRAPNESENLTLSNFYAREDRQSGHVCVFLPRLFARGMGPGPASDFTADLTCLTVSVGD